MTSSETARLPSVEDLVFPTKELSITRCRIHAGIPRIILSISRLAALPGCLALATRLSMARPYVQRPPLAKPPARHQRLSGQARTLVRVRVRRPWGTCQGGPLLIPTLHS